MDVGASEALLEYVQVVSEAHEEITIFVPATNLLVALTRSGPADSNNDMKGLHKTLPALSAEKNLADIDFENLAKTSAAYHPINKKKGVVISGKLAGAMVRARNAEEAETNRGDVLEGLSSLYGENDFGLALAIAKTVYGKIKASVLEPAAGALPRLRRALSAQGAGAGASAGAGAEAARTTKQAALAPAAPAKEAPIYKWNPWLGPAGADNFEDSFNSEYECVMPNQTTIVMVSQLWYPMSTMIDGFVFNPIRSMSRQDQVSFNNCIWQVKRRFRGYIEDGRGYIEDDKRLYSIAQTGKDPNCPNHMPWKLVTAWGLLQY